MQYTGAYYRDAIYLTRPGCITTFTKKINMAISNFTISKVLNSLLPIY